MFTWPLDNPIVTRGFAYKADIYIGGQHAALDIVRPSGTLGSPIKAIAAGLVIAVAYDNLSGNVISIDHDGGWRSHYRHLQEVPTLTEGSVVAQGHVIGKVGSTGLSTGPHLHFDLWNKTKRDVSAFYKNGWWAHDPLLYLGKVQAEEDDEMKLYAIKGSAPSIYITDGLYKRRISSAGGVIVGSFAKVHSIENSEVIVVHDKFLDWLRPFPEGPG